MEYIYEVYEQTSALALTLIAIVVLVLWFLPAILALFFNPKHVKWIAIACVPAGFSFIAWGAVILWATTGKVIDKFKDKVESDAT